MKFPTAELRGITIKIKHLIIFQTGYTKKRTTTVYTNHQSVENYDQQIAEISEACSHMMGVLVFGWETWA